jgi:excisionase family DNA binding protein
MAGAIPPWLPPLSHRCTLPPLAWQPQWQLLWEYHHAADTRPHTFGNSPRGGVSAAARLSQEFFSPAAIADYLGMSTYTVQDLCRRGELHHVKVGRAIRIRKAWADDYMTAHQREPLRRTAA